jgi:NAD+ synthase
MRKILLPKLQIGGPNDTISLIQRWIVDTMPAYASGAVLGMSGGIDSTVVAALTQQAFKDRDDLILYGYALPTKLNSPADVEDAQWVADTFKIPFHVIDLDPAVRGMDNIFPRLEAYHRGNMISRTRANVLHTYAAKQNAIVMGTGNRDEDYGVGYYTLLGDGAVEMNPIGFLSKRLVREVGRCFGLPARLVERVPTAGLEANQTDEKDLGYTYAFVELVIEGLDQGFSLRDLTVHPQIRNEMPLAGARDSAIFDILHRHDLALRKAKKVVAKVPDIKLERS